jgi:hypothetical protein
MADAMTDLEGELQKQREAEAVQAKLKAQQQALFDLSSKPAELSQKQEPALATSSSSTQPAACISRVPRSITSDVDVSNNAGVYIPPTWNTAGQEPDLSIQRRQKDGECLVDNEAISLSMCGFGGSGEGIGTQLFAMAGLNPPSEASFETFFRGWFETEHFPMMSEELKRELVQRAKTKGFFSGLSSQVKKWAMANTDVRLQSEAWCTYFLQNAPPHYRVFGCVRKASVNLGSQVAPCWVTFYGIPEKDGGAKWILPPFCHGTADIPHVLDELDGRGGMTALVQAAAS